MNSKEHIFIDGSNLFIEGQRRAAYVATPQADRPSDIQQSSCDLEYRIDLARLHAFLNPGASPPVMVGSRSIQGELFFEMARRAGFDTALLDRNSLNREKAVDMTLAMRAIERAWGNPPSSMRFVLVAGDRDYVPLVTFLRERGFETDVVFWSHAAPELRRAASRFVDLDPHFEYLRWQPPTTLRRFA